MILRTRVPLLILILQANLFFGYHELLAQELPFFPPLENVLSQFKRRITVLEVGLTSVPYVYPLVLRYNAICTALIFDAGWQEFVRTIRDADCQNITVLAPGTITYEMLHTLGRCEHFDVVILHDISSYIRATGVKMLDAFINLGDHVFIETTSTGLQNELKRKRIPQVAQQKNMSLYYSYKQKTSLDIARYTQKSRPVCQAPKYHVQSSFAEKYFMKKGLKEATTWVDGINLVTFIMLNGVYPDDTLIRKQLTTMRVKCVDHNDLVLGNVIVQGRYLMPIDFGDKRRSANVEKCLNAALSAFSEGNSRQKNPRKWMDDYYRTI